MASSPSDGEEVQSATTQLTIITDNLKTKLRELRPFLQQDIASLVQSAEPIRTIFSAIQDQLPAALEETLLPAAHIEILRPRYIQACRRLADRNAQEQSVQEFEETKTSANILNAQIKTLTERRPDIVAEIDRLKQRKAELSKELRAVEASLKVEEENLKQLPHVIEELRKKRDADAKKALKLRKNTTPIEGSADADRKEIEEIDSVRLRALSAIDSVLGL